jgi:hypothetical protein
VIVKAKEDITCYEIGGTYKVSWESRTIEPSDTNLPSYYIVKGSSWELNVKLNGLRIINDKDRLQTYCRAFSIPVNSIVLATEKEAKKLKARGVKDFISSFNAMHDVTWINSDEINKMKSYGTRNLEISDLKEFKNLSNTNPVKQFILELIKLHDKYSEVGNILCFLDGYDSSSSYKMPVKANEIIVSKILSAYGDDLTDYLIVAKAMEK